MSSRQAVGGGAEGVVELDVWVCRLHKKENVLFTDRARMSEAGLGERGCVFCDLV